MARPAGKTRLKTNDMHCSRIIPFLILLLNGILFVPVLYSDSKPDNTRVIKFTGGSSGALGSKTGKDGLMYRTNPLPNHGFIYSTTSLECSLLQFATCKTRIRVWNGEISRNRKYEYVLEPEIELFYKAKMFEFAFQGGYLDDITIGHGLTIKDFSQTGFIANFMSRQWEGSFGQFGQGFILPEDHYFCTVDPLFLPVKATAYIKIMQGEGLDRVRYYQTGYLLPAFEFGMPFGCLYGELGVKINRDRDVDTIFEKSPKTACAGLVGLNVTHSGKRLTVNGSLELRAYQKGFIPVTGIEITRFNKIWDEYDSRSNWVDFFDSRESSGWVYTFLNARFHLFSIWHFFSGMRFSIFSVGNRK